MSYQNLYIETSGERFYEITKQVGHKLDEILQVVESTSGILQLFVKHTSCGLTISEAYDPSAVRDVENFLKQVAPRNQTFITHTTEGEDDSPSHMKSILLQQSLGLIVDRSSIVLGQWQGIYLGEFRDSPKRREILLKFVGD